MSQFTTLVGIKFKDLKALKAALTEMGITKWNEGKDLKARGYYGSVAFEDVALVVPREAIAHYSDLVFQQMVDGTLSLSIDEYGMYRSSLHCTRRHGQQQIGERIAQGYVEQVVRQEARGRGFNVGPTQVAKDGTVELVLTRWG